MSKVNSSHSSHLSHPCSSSSTFRTSHPHPSGSRSTPFEDSDKSLNDQPPKELRLWIGNLDPKLTEFHLLKLVQRFGLIDNFDFLFHRSGPNAGLPRGYAFVTYKDTEAANKCLNGLNGKRILEKYVAVRWAHQETQNYPDDDEKIKSKLPALGMKTEIETPQSKEKTISAIEAKLRSMERDTEGTSFNLAGPGLSKKGTITLSRTSAHNTNNNNNSSSGNNVQKRGQYGYRHNKYSHSDKYRQKPYGRNAPRR